MFTKTDAQSLLLVITCLFLFPHIANGSTTCESAVQGLGETSPLTITIPIYNFTKRLRAAGVVDDDQLKRSVIHALANTLDNISFSHEKADKVVDLREVPPGQVIYIMESEIMAQYLKDVNTAADFMLLVQHAEGYDRYRYPSEMSETLISEQSIFRKIVDLDAVSQFFKLQPSSDQQMEFLKFTQSWGSIEVKRKTAESIITAPQTPELFIEAEDVLEGLMRSPVDQLFELSEQQDVMGTVSSVLNLEKFLQSNVGQFFELNPTVNHGIALIRNLSPGEFKKSVFDEVLKQVDTPEERADVIKAFHSPQLKDETVVDLRVGNAAKTIKGLNDRQFQLWLNGNIEMATDEFLEGRIIPDDIIHRLTVSRAPQTIKGLNDQQFQLWLNGNIEMATDEFLEGRIIPDDIIHRLTVSRAPQTIKGLNDRQFQLWLNGNIEMATDEFLEGRIIPDSVVHKLTIARASQTIQGLDNHQFQLWLDKNGDAVTDELLETKLADNSV